MRLFVAVELSPEMKSALLDTQDQMRAQRVTGSFTPIENLHVTLAFIGDYPDPEDVPLPEFAPFELKLSGYGSFGDLWWVGLEKSPPLEACARRLRRRLADAGIPFDKKRFSPHITLVRRAVGQPAIEVPEVSMIVDLRTGPPRHDLHGSSEAGRLHGGINTCQPFKALMRPAPISPATGSPSTQESSSTHSRPMARSVTSTSPRTTEMPKTASWAGRSSP